MMRRVRSNRNQVGSRRVRTDASMNKCPPGEKWVPGHYRNGSYVRGHCARINGPRASNSSIQKEQSTRYGWDRGPVWVRENRTTEKVDFRTESNSDEH